LPTRSTGAHKAAGAIADSERYDSTEVRDEVELLGGEEFFNRLPG
jgi:hypothetical protein